MDRHELANDVRTRVACAACFCMLCSGSSISSLLHLSSIQCLPYSAMSTPTFQVGSNEDDEEHETDGEDEEQERVDVEEKRTGTVTTLVNKKY